MKEDVIGPIALTMGEPAGIGGEIALKAWMERELQDLPCFCLLDDPRRLERIAEGLGWSLRIAVVESLAQAAQAFPHALPVLRLDLPGRCEPGHPDPANADAVLGAIKLAVELVLDGQAAALVTNPIHKAVLYEAGFAHPGHTEYLAALCRGRPDPVMMLACPGLKVVPVTVHLPLAQAITALTSERIVRTGRVTADELRRRFGIARPRLAVAGLNPHAGEDGRLGREEIEVIAPAVASLQAEGLSVVGPQPADSLFHAAKRRSFDAALCMYHDQALIPLKTIDFDGGVNITLGLPLIRTSPDHGTAFDIAGSGTASARSLIAALRMAADMARAGARQETSSVP